MPHQRGHLEKQNVFVPGRRLNVPVSPTLTSFINTRGERETRTTFREQDIKAAFRGFQAASRKRRQRFRETRGLFTTGLNLSRLRALSSIR